MTDVNQIVVSDMIARGWENFLARPEGPLNIRFSLQPTIAAAMALRTGIRDAREGRPAFLWAACFGCRRISCARATSSWWTRPTSRPFSVEQTA
ncbi:MAG: hypothetical protein K2X43_24350 [Hyphomonadaceae bacterium]|nr:hypothetical protein [Hyphomonadaceae bacterium]